MDQIAKDKTIAAKARTWYKAVCDLKEAQKKKENILIMNRKFTLAYLDLKKELESENESN